MNRQQCRQAFERFAASNPTPATELGYSNHFELLVAVLLSAQATDKSVNRVTPALFGVAGTAQAMLDLGLEGIESHIRTIGLYKSKARHLLATCRILVEQHAGQVPHDRQQLEALPGVGRKTANVVLNIAFGEPVMAVDTHIFRVANRTRMASGSTPRQVEDKLMRCIPAEFMQHAHHWLILHGRYTCMARKPRCRECVIADLCQWSEKTIP